MSSIDSKFSIGKYINRDFTSVGIENLDYMLWYGRSMGEFPRLAEHITKITGEPHYYKDGKLLTSKLEAAMEIVIKNKLAYVTFTKNPDSAGWTQVHNGLLFLKFDEVSKPQNYNGYEYFLPIINGKPTRIKNRKFKVYLSKNDNTVQVHHYAFNIIKIEKV